MTGQKATSTCPYAYEGEPTAAGFCEHSLINGVSAQDYYNLVQLQQAGLVPGAVPGLEGTTDPTTALDPAAAAAAAAQQQALIDAMNAANAAAAAQAALNAQQGQ